jgi:hypothetical protein
VVEDFGVFPALEEWDYVLMQSVGRTEMSDDELREHGIAIPELEVLRSYSLRNYSNQTRLPRILK